MKNLTRLVSLLFALALASAAYANDAKAPAKEECKDCKEKKECCCKDGSCEKCKAEKKDCEKCADKAPEKK